jgi:hypothetical protein
MSAIEFEKCHLTVLSVLWLAPASLVTAATAASQPLPASSRQSPWLWGPMEASSLPTETITEFGALVQAE